MFVHTLPLFLIDFFKKTLIFYKFKEISIRKTFLIPQLPTAKLCCVMSVWNALLVAFFLINIEVLIVFPLHGQTPSFCLPGLHTRTSTIPHLLLGNQDRHTNMTVSLALVMKEIAYPLAVLSAMLYHVPQSLTLGQDTGGISKRIANMDLETAEGATKEVCSGMSGWRRWKRGNRSLSPPPEEPEGIKRKQATKLKWTKGNTFPNA